jgi:hypothetical protein
LQWVVKIKILDAKFEKTDLNAVMNENCKHLSIQYQEKLLNCLDKFEDLFDGTLDWDTGPVALKLKEGAKPYYDWPFPPKAHKETLKKRLRGYVR